jgi:hypothetical protein
MRTCINEKNEILLIIGVLTDKTEYTSSFVIYRQGMYIKNSHAYAHAYEYKRVSFENRYIEDVDDAIISLTKKPYMSP